MNIFKNLLTTLAVAATLLTTQIAKATADDDIQFCLGYSEFAEYVMHDVQRNVAMTNFNDLQLEKFGVWIVKTAYKSDQFTEDWQKRLVAQDFADEVFLRCIGNIKNIRTMKM